jgi:hypothetical protein
MASVDEPELGRVPFGPGRSQAKQGVGDADDEGRRIDSRRRTRAAPGR